MCIRDSHTPAVVWREDYLEQPNAVTGVAGVIGEVDDVDEAGEAFGSVFGDRVARRGEAVEIDHENLTVALLSGAELRARFGLEPTGEAALRVLQLGTRSMETTARALDENEVEPFRPEKGTLRVPPEDACGALIEFVAR